MRLYSLRIWRALIPLGFLALTAVLLWRHQYPLPPDAAVLLWLSRLDPLLALSEWRFSGALPVWLWLPLGVVILTILFGRVFCGWICPVGGILARISSRGNRPVPQWLQANRYWWPLFLLILLLLGNNWPLFLSPFHLLTAEFTRLLQGKIAWLLAGMLLGGIWFFPRFWCAYVCPTGLLLAALSRWRPFYLAVGNNCIDCGICEKVCPTQAIRLAEGKMAEDCMLCGRCWQACPPQAIHGRNDGIVRQRDLAGAGFSRRQFFKGGLAVVAAGYGWQLLQPATAMAVIRPPGALPEADFLARCSRCGRCVKVCPANCLFPMPVETGFAAFLTPRVIPRQARCELCMLCQEVCPTGAIVQVPVEQVKMGLAELERRKCLVWTEGKLCLLCREQCPVHAIDVDEQNRPVVNRNLCVGCGACENGCPLAEAAIVVKPLKNND